MRRSGPPVRPPPPPLPLPTPSCRFFQSRAWKEGDAAGSGSPVAAARGSILQPPQLVSSPTAFPLPSRAAPPPGAWRRRRPPAQQHQPGASSGFRPARSKAAAAKALLPRGASASARRTCRAGLAPSPSARGVCKVSSRELRCSRPLSAPRPHPGSPSAPAGAQKAARRRLGFPAALGTPPAPSGQHLSAAAEAADSKLGAHAAHTTGRVLP